MTYKRDIWFDELKKAEYIFENGFDAGRVSKREVSLLSKLFFSKGMKTKEVRKRLSEFCHRNSVGFNDVIYRGLLDDAIKNGKKYYLEQSDIVPITKKELDIIKSLPTKYSKFLFVMLVFAKYNNVHSVIKRTEENNSSKSYYAYNTIRDILSRARITMSNSDIDDMCKYFLKQGYIDYNISEKKGRNPFEIWKVLFVDAEGESEIIVGNMDDIISFLPAFCERCGGNINRIGRQKYCENCWKEKHRENMRNRYISKKQ